MRDKPRIQPPSRSSKAETEPQTATLLSRPKSQLFAAIVVITPLALLLLIEFSLRLFSYGSDFELIRTKTIGNRDYYVLNRHAGARYFAQADIVIPEFHEERFVRVKGKNTRRVFCLGESTMEGFPYEFNATAPSFLKDRLLSQLPGDSIEVINVGLSAVGSFVVHDVMRQLLDYEPDLFIVYLGHNEFYGAYGGASRVGPGSTPWLTRLSLRLLHLRTYLLLRDAYAWVTGHFNRSSLPADATLMQLMVGSPPIPLDSKTYRMTLEAYRQNLLEIIDDARSHHVPLLFSTLVSNERDQPPFVGLFDDRTSPHARKEWASMLGQGDSLLQAGQARQAAQVLQDVVALDSGNATGYFALARALEAEGQFKQARIVYMQAKDLDALRFRATEEFQQTLLGVCRQENVACARADSAFAAASPHGIVGHELILEHLHPNVHGYFLLASVWAHAIQENGFLAPGGHWQSAAPDSLLMQQSTVSAFDEDLGMIKTALLTRKWPFRAVPDPLPYRPPDTVASIVLSYVRHQVSWPNARYELAAYYARQGRQDLARKECLAVSRIISFSYEPLLRVADYYKEEGKKDEAAMAYRQCISTEDNPYAHMKLGLLLLEAGSDSSGAEELGRGFALDGQSGMHLPANARATGRYLLGIAYARRGRIEAAKESLKLALMLDPTMKPARDLLNELP